MKWTKIIFNTGESLVLLEEQYLSNQKFFENRGIKRVIFDYKN